MATSAAFRGRRDAKGSKHVKRGSRPVYSTSHGRLCPGCAQPLARCSCERQASAKPPPTGDGIVRVGRQTKGRKGRGVTTVTGVPLAGSELNALAKELKKHCGSGGTVRDGTIEIQGDHRDLLVRELGKRGWRVKRSGG